MRSGRPSIRCLTHHLLSSNIFILCRKGATIIVAVQVLAEERKKQSDEDDELCVKEDEMMEVRTDPTRTDLHQLLRAERPPQQTG